MIATLLLIANALLCDVYASWELLPKNSHQLYQTYGLLQDDSSALIYTGAARSRGVLSSSFAIVGNAESPAHPQFVIHAALGAGLRHSDNHLLEAEALDTRFSLAYEAALDPALRFSLGIRHQSGHAADGEQNLTLLLDDYVSDYQLVFRAVYDLGPYLRAGATLKPFLHTNPSMEVFAADEFVEVFPFSGSDHPHIPSAYIAVGLEQGGTQRFGLVNTFHAQVGAYWGNHFSNEFRQSLRTVLGYSSGADPRLKAFQLTDLRRSFGYVGLMLDL